MTSQIFYGSETDGPFKPLDEATWLPQRAYTDEAVYEAELRSIFLKHWVGVFHHTALPKVGDFRTMTIAGRPLLFVRDQKRDIRCYLNICRHRGMAVAQGRGNCKGFVCPYHTWAYDLDGRVVATPQHDGSWAKGDVRLSEVKVDALLGYIFINFDPHAAPVAARLGGVAEELAVWGNADLELLFEKIYVCRFNWKLMWENAIEAYHLLGTHRESLSEFTPVDMAYATIPQDATNYGILHTGYKGAGLNAFGAQSRTASLIPNLPAWAAKEARHYTMWPSTQMSTGAESLNGFFILPGNSIDECQVVWSMAVSRAAKEHPDYAGYKAEQMAFADLIMKEDSVPCEQIEQTYRGCGDWKPGPYALTEKMCWYFHRWYLDKIGAH